MTTTRLAIVIAVLAAALIVPSTAGAVRSEFYGIVQTATLSDGDITGMQNAKVHTSRSLISWASIQPKQSTFNWGSTDKFIGRLASKGVRLVPTLWASPSWVAPYIAHPPIDTSSDLQAWQTFLKAIVGRYGPGGSYWKPGNYFQNKYPGAASLPIQTWQMWNEPNLKKYWTPYPAPKQYGKLLKASYTAIKAKSPSAQVMLGGMPGYGDVNAWDFLNQLYNQVAGAKGYFDIAALHPYGPTLDKVKTEIQKFRAVMKNHSDGGTPLWITEIAWGSSNDGAPLNKGLQGQATMLEGAYNMILNNRAGWNIQRLFWYHWRDPQSSHANCTFCATAGLIKYDHTAKPALAKFKTFSTDSTAPTTTITSGPSNGSTITNPTPTFQFKADELGTTFECRVDANSFKACASPFKTAHLSNSSHSFSVRATDAAGNVGAAASRSFTVVAP